MSHQHAVSASVHVLGAVHGVAPDGSTVEVPSASQRRLLGLLAVHAPRQLRTEWLADVLGVTAGALRTTVSRLRSTIGQDMLRTTSTGYSSERDVDATLFCQAVTEAAKCVDNLGALEQALALWTGPVLEEFEGELSDSSTNDSDQVDGYATIHELRIGGHESIRPDPA